MQAGTTTHRLSKQLNNFTEFLSATPSEVESIKPFRREVKSLQVQLLLNSPLGWPHPTWGSPQLHLIQVMFIIPRFALQLFNAAGIGNDLNMLINYILQERRCSKAQKGASRWLSKCWKRMDGFSSINRSTQSHWLLLNICRVWHNQQKYLCKNTIPVTPAHLITGCKALHQTEGSGSTGGSQIRIPLAQQEKWVCEPTAVFCLHSSG